METHKIKASCKKIMASVFWDTKGIIYRYIDYLSHDTAINEEYYAILLKMVHRSVKDEYRGKLKGDAFMRQHSTPVCSCQIAMAAVKECGF